MLLFFKTELFIWTPKGYIANQPSTVKYTLIAKETLLQTKHCYLFEKLPTTMYDIPPEQLVFSEITKRLILLYSMR